MKRDYSSRIAAVIAWYLCLFLSDAYADLIINSTETFALNPANSEVISIDGDLIIENGGTLQGASNTEIRLNGDWDNSANGSFIHGNTKVFFTGSGISIIKGNNQFHHLVINKKDAASGQEFTGSEIQIESGTTQTISSQLILNGTTVDDRLKIRSTTNGVSHTLNASGAAYVEAWFLDVDDSTFIGNIDIPMNIDSSSIAAPVVGSGNNGDWVPNIPPVATALSMTAIEQTETGGITLTGTNFDGAVPKVFKITKLPVNGVLKDNATVIQSGSLPYTIVGTLTYTSTSDSALIDSFTFKANDGELDSEVPATVSIAINPVNDAPIISGTPDATVAEDTAYSFTPIATDVDIGYAHTFIINDKRPLWANFEPKTGALTGTPDNSAVGSYEDIVISVTDGIDRVALDPFTLTVTNTNDAPEGEVTISGIVGNNQILTASNNLSDVDGLGAITYRWLADGVNIAGANQGTYLLTQADVNKTITVVASYTDAQGMQEFVPSNNTTTQIQESALSQLAADIENNTSAYYEAAGITDVSETNLNSINNALDTVGVSTQIQVQKLVNSYNVILDFTENDLPGAIPPTVEDYSNIGIIGITQNSIILGLLSDVIELGDGVDVDSISKLQTITDAVLALNDQAENAANTLSKSQLEILGVEAVTDDNLSDIRLIIAETSEQLDQVAVIQLLVDRVVASHIIQTYRTNIVDNQQPSLIEYWDLGLTHINSVNIQAINSAIVTIAPSAIDTIEKITAVLSADSDFDEVIDLIDNFPFDPHEIEDKDADKIGDNTDNCPTVANKEQLDLDRDTIGDSCDHDKDNDGVVNTSDNCPIVANKEQLDLDGDTIGDSCDHDKDNDGVVNTSDNCPTVANKEQLDLDDDTVGDSCDHDKDNDGVVNTSDNCPIVANKEQLDLDGDTVGDSCDHDKDNDGVVNTSDNCPIVANKEQLDLDGDTIGDSCDHDNDNDGVVNTSDNCPIVANKEQLDLDGDTVGDSCDHDKDNDGVVNTSDNCPIVANKEQLDLDGDTVGDSCDHDKDNDGVVNTSDNCPNTINRSQSNFDSDAYGDVCDPDEDNDGVFSAEDAFRFNSNYSTDSDGDGMPDAFEREYGFDVNNSGDKTTDSDGDKVTNIDEFLAGTNPRVNLNPGLPKLVIPKDIEVVSTGRMTAVNIGEASATDGSQKVLQPVASFEGPFVSGRHEITWTAIDDLGNQSLAVQVIKVLPLANLTPSSLVAEGSVVKIRALISGDAADYPVEIPFTISGSADDETDYQIDQFESFITIDQGREGSVSISINVDNEPENDETIEVQIFEPSNAVLGSVTQRTISIIDGNLPPQISVVVDQEQTTGRVVAADKGEVIITAEVTDPNQDDSHNFSWQIEPQQLTAVISEELIDNKKILVLDPSQLEPGIFSITAVAEDNAEIVSSAEVKTDIKLMEAAPELSSETDSDSDGVPDAEEGYSDSDNDGIVDYMDNISESNLAPISEDSSSLLQAPAGTQLILGEIAFANSKNTVLVSKQQVIDIINKRQLELSEGVYDKDYDYPIGLYDFTITGAIPGRSYYLVIPLPSAIKEGQIFRKYMGSKIGWQNFVENAENILFSAQAVNGACPEPASRLYDYGLQPGSNCMQVYIQDGGPNDADGRTDGIVTDPAGIAVFNKQIDENISNANEISDGQSGDTNNVEENNATLDKAPSSSHSRIKISKSVIYVSGDSATIEITAMSHEGKLLDSLEINTKCIFCLGVSISPFTQTKLGVYEATITSGRQISFGYIEAELTNEFGSAKLAPQKLNVIYRPSGGCTIVANGRSDISLFLMLILLTLYHRRKKPLI